MKFVTKNLLVFLLPVVCLVARAADYPTLYVVGAFQNWQMADALAVESNSEGVYTVNLDIEDGRESFKMSFSGNRDWEQFDRLSFGPSISGQWSPGIYTYGPRIENSYLPVGKWVMTVYYNQQMVALSAPGQPVPQPGDDVTIPGKTPSGTLPVLYIEVRDANGDYNNEIIDYALAHKNYFEGTYRLDLNGCEWLAALGAESVGSADDMLPLEIKARGNYTRTGFSKKPFKIKLGKKQSLLGLTKSKHFALMAHADDTYGFLRNFTGFNLGRRIGLPWTPMQQPVEVVINGNYRGLYFLTESIRIDEDRVNIREGADGEADPKYISGGYIVELDNYDESTDAQIRMSERACVDGHYLDALRITFDTPEVYSDLQRRFITDQFTMMNEAVGNCSNALWEYMDLDDAARYYIVNEIVSDTESYHGSTYLFRDYGEGRKWHFSPLWDFGNAFNGNTNDYFYNNDPFGNTWIPSMRVNDKFNAKVRETWLWFMSNCYDGLESDMAEYIDHITTAADYDNRRWTGVDIPQRSVSSSNISERLKAARQHLRDKTAWLARQWGDYTNATYTEPARDNTPAAPLPDYAATGLESVTVGDVDNIPTVYYNLQGMPVSKPQKGQIYILSSGEKVVVGL